MSMVGYKEKKLLLLEKLAAENNPEVLERVLTHYETLTHLMKDNHFDNKNFSQKKDDKSVVNITLRDMYLWDTHQLKDWIYEVTGKKTLKRAKDKLLKEAEAILKAKTNTWNSILTYDDDPFSDMKVAD